MLLRYLHKDKLTVPVAMAFLTIGLMLIAVSLGVPRIAILHARFGKNELDFIRGLLIGIAIAFEITAVTALAPHVAKMQRGE